MIEKKWLSVLVLFATLGCVGAHRFYVGKIATGLLRVIIVLGIVILFLSMVSTGIESGVNLLTNPSFWVGLLPMVNSSTLVSDIDIGPGRGSIFLIFILGFLAFHIIDTILVASGRFSDAKGNALAAPDAKDSYKWSSTVLFAMLWGLFGAHRFYVRKTGTGIIWFCTLGLWGVGALVDLIMIARGSFKDKDGNKIAVPRLECVES